MQIDHIALYTRDLERLCEFYTKYFDGTAGKLYQNEETGTQACFVSFADGARLEIVTRPQFEDAEHSRLWTGWAHTSFKAGTRENVDALTEQMRSEGYEITDGPVVGKDGCYGSFVLRPGRQYRPHRSVKENANEADFMECKRPACVHGQGFP